MDTVRERKQTWLHLAGILLLVYAVLGNYVALPGYIRFLERGGTSETGNSVDASVLFGAARTILWMYSFQLGVLALVIARSVREGLHTKPIIVVATIWLAAWSWHRFQLQAPGSISCSVGSSWLASWQCSRSHSRNRPAG